MSEKENMEYKPEVKVEGEQDQERRHVVTFKRPYLFERKEYAEVDLSGLDELTVKDAIEVQRQLFGRGLPVDGDDDGLCPGVGSQSQREAGGVL